MKKVEEFSLNKNCEFHEFSMNKIIPSFLLSRILDSFTFHALFWLIYQAFLDPEALACFASFAFAVGYQTFYMGLSQNRVCIPFQTLVNHHFAH